MVPSTSISRLETFRRSIHSATPEASTLSSRLLENLRVELAAHNLPNPFRRSPFAIHIELAP